MLGIVQVQTSVVQTPSLGVIILYGNSSEPLDSIGAQSWQQLYASNFFSRAACCHSSSTELSKACFSLSISVIISIKIKN